MPIRTHQIFSGKTFKVPTHIVRLDSRNTHGWQLRYGPSKLFSDHSTDGSGAAKSLKLAKDELELRLKKLPAPNGLRTETRGDKLNGMPLGISGPVKRVRAGRGSVQYYLQVTFPVFGSTPVNRSIYIASESTLTKEKYAAALQRAVALRESGVRKFKLATTKGQRGQSDGVSPPSKPKAAAPKAATKVVAKAKAAKPLVVKAKAAATQAPRAKAAPKSPVKPTVVRKARAANKTAAKPVTRAKATKAAAAKPVVAAKAGGKPVSKPARKSARAK